MRSIQMAAADTPLPQESTLGMYVRANRWRRWYQATATVVICAVVVVLLTLDLGPSVPAGGPLAGHQARVIDSILDDSVVGRGYLFSAIDDVNACAVTPSTLILMRNAMASRADMLDRAKALVVTDLPYGDRIKTNLVIGARASYDADRGYLLWVLEAGESCPIRSGAIYDQILRDNLVSQTAKNELLEDWNPVARTYGMPERSRTVI